MKPIIEACIPYYGYGVRFRILLRLREYFRIHRLFGLAQFVKGILLHKYGCEISVNAIVSPQAVFMHYVGIVIGEGCIVEKGVIIYSGVVLGRKDIKKEDDYPVIKSGSVLCTGCTVLGNVMVGNNSIVAAKSLVLTNTEPHSTYAGIPARRIK